MPSTYTNLLRLELQADGENDGTWGQIVNDNVIALLEDAVAGTAPISTTGGTTTLSTSNGAVDQARNKVLDITGSLGSDAIIEVPAQSKTYYVRNATSGSQTVEVLVTGQSAGAGIKVPQGKTQALYCDGSNVEQAGAAISGTGETALLDSDLAANGGTVPEENRENKFNGAHTIKGTSPRLILQSTTDADGGGFRVQDSGFNEVAGIRFFGFDGAGSPVEIRLENFDFLYLKGGGLRIGDPSSGNTGAGTVNAEEVYEDGNRVVESGSNSDGRWTRWADGTQICFVTLSGSTSAAITWTFPKPFSSGSSTVISGTVQSSGNTVVIVHDSVPSNNSVDLSTRDTTTARTNNAFRVQATGRWF